MGVVNTGAAPSQLNSSPIVCTPHRSDGDAVGKLRQLKGQDPTHGRQLPGPAVGKEQWPVGGEGVPSLRSGWWGYCFAWQCWPGLLTSGTAVVLQCCDLSHVFSENLGPCTSWNTPPLHICRVSARKKTRFMKHFWYQKYQLNKAIIF